MATHDNATVLSAKRKHSHIVYDMKGDLIGGADSFREAVYIIHEKWGKTHFGGQTTDGSICSQTFVNEDGKAVATLDWVPGAKSERKAKPTRKTRKGRKGGRKAAESGKSSAKPAVHFTKAQKELLMAGLRRFVNGLR